MKGKRHYVIGDIHGEYQMLMELVEQLPNDAKLIFVGDLVNRGAQSREVIDFVKKRAFKVVKGNHEGYLLEFGAMFIDSFENNDCRRSSNIWLHKSASEVLRSYNLLKQGSFEVIRNREGLERLKRDLAWIKRLPLYFEMGEVEGYQLPIVITHGSIGDFWYAKESNPVLFEEQALRNRNPPSLESPIFNIYGHESRKDILVGENFINLDTGSGKYCDGKLTAYCIESREVFESLT